MISDYFFESMILLKIELCWEWTDVLYFVTNQRQERVKLTESLSSQITAWNSIDAKLFAKANETFWQKYNKLENVDQLRADFQVELDKVKSFCLLTDDRECAPGDPKCSKSMGVKLKGFELRPEAKSSTLCTDLVRP